MAEQIISASGIQYPLIINSDGSINTSNSVVPLSTNNPLWQFIYIISGTATGVTGSRIGSIIQFIGTGSYIQRLMYNNDFVVNVGSWS